MIILKYVTFSLYMLAYIAIRYKKYENKKFTVREAKVVHSRTKTITSSLPRHSPKHAIARGKGGSMQFVTPGPLTDSMCQVTGTGSRLDDTHLKLSVQFLSITKNMVALMAFALNDGGSSFF